MSTNGLIAGSSARGSTGVPLPIVVATLVFVLVSSVGGRSSNTLADEAVDRAFAAFFDAFTFNEMMAATDAIAMSGTTFDDAYGRLKKGRTYSENVPTGVVEGQRREYGSVYYYSLDVPADYDPNRRYPVRIHLHGGVDARAVGGRRGGEMGRLPGDEPRIHVLPTAWSRARWWFLC